MGKNCEGHECFVGIHETSPLGAWRKFGYDNTTAFPRSGFRRVVSKGNRAFQAASRNPYCRTGACPCHCGTGNSGKHGKACRPGRSGGERVRTANSGPQGGYSPANAQDPRPSLRADTAGELRRVRRMRRRHRTETADSDSVGAVLRQMPTSKGTGLTLADVACAIGNGEAIIVIGRKSGRTIPIPVWFVVEGEKLRPTSAGLG